jgi:sulfur-carrier protein adenylyltransferase/sulfurtransferase
MLDQINVLPSEVHEMRKKNEKLFLLDCREPWEHQAARIEGATLIPMQQIPANLDAIPREGKIVVYCHAGMRSHSVASWLQDQGYDAVSMSGGIDRWSAEIDPQVPRY